MGVARTIEVAVPPVVSSKLRAWKNRNNLFGLHAPARVLIELVPKGTTAIDAGAAHGLYTYFISRAADRTLAFEPNPAQFHRLHRARLRGVEVFQAALSDTDGTATLHVPDVLAGEASLHVHPERGYSIHSFEVRTRRIDDLGLDELGFLKIDVEGHEREVLAGGVRCLERFRPTVFIELEERHTSGVVTKVCSFMTELGYFRQEFFLRGLLHDMSEFEISKHQTAFAADPSSPDYVSNFLFRA